MQIFWLWAPLHFDDCCTHLHFSHGSNHGEPEVGGESIALDTFDPQDPSSIHIQTLCRVNMGDKSGVGVLEQLTFGPHAPTGLTGLVDGYTPARSRGARLTPSRLTRPSRTAPASRHSSR